MTAAPRPPDVARRLLERALPSEVRDAVTGDLAEVFTRDCREHGLAEARRRYRRKAAALSLRFLFERARDLPRPRLSWLDVKLAIRMLVKYPGLTIVGGLAMAFAIAIGAAAFEAINQILSPALPLADGRRIVGIRLWHTASNGIEEQGLWDFTTWRGRLETIEDLGVFRTVDRNLIGAAVPGEPILTAETTAAAFAVARVPPLLGRTLNEADEHPGAPLVVVLGYDVWQSRFGGDAGVLGRTVDVGAAPHVVVGVMPDGFSFPRTHDLWVPLRAPDLQFARRQGPWVYIFGRLAPGMSMTDAQAELTALGQRAAAQHPDTHAHIRPEVRPFAEVVSTPLEIGPATLRSINLFFSLLFALVAANIALLMFARAAARQTEFFVRTALGASRGRIAGQLFAEALALGSVALAIGLSAASLLLRWWLEVARAEADGRLPFWATDRLATSTLVYAALLTLLGAAIAGIVPALKATGRRLDARLRQTSAGGGGLRFGGIWTFVIVAQVALTVAFPATAFFVRQAVDSVKFADAGFAADRYLAASLEMDPEFAREADGIIRASFPEARFRATTAELARRLAGEPGIAGVTFADHLPRTNHQPRRIAIDRGGPVGFEARVGAATVGIEYFEVLAAPIQAGRGFTAADVEPHARSVVVNASFVRDVLGGRNAVGVRIRELPANAGDTSVPGPWLDIVGVAPDLGVMAGSADVSAGYYRAAGPGSVRPSHLVVHVAGDVASAAARVQSIAATVDPALRLHDVVSLGDGDPTNWLEFEFLFGVITLVSGMAMLLSLASISAALSFAVSRRAREIGIRVALGATPARVAMATVARPIAHVGVGVVCGGALTAALAFAVTGGVSLAGSALVLAYGTVMLILCLTPSIAPLRRALRLDPTDALRREA